MYQAMILPFSFLTMLLLVMLGTDYSWFCSYFYLIDLICNLIYKWFILYCMYLFMSRLLFFLFFLFWKGLRLIYQNKIVYVQFENRLINKINRKKIEM